MADNSGFGTPHQPVAPSGTQITEPSPWHLLYDLNATIARVDEAVSGLKERTSSIDRRVEDTSKKVEKLGDAIHEAKGSIRALMWVAAVVGPLLTLFLEVALKHFKVL